MKHLKRLRTDTLNPLISSCGSAILCRDKCKSLAHNTHSGSTYCTSNGSAVKPMTYQCAPFVRIMSLRILELESGNG